MTLFVSTYRALKHWKKIWRRLQMNCLSQSDNALTLLCCSHILILPTTASEWKLALVSGATCCNNKRTRPWQIRFVTNISGFFNTGLEGQYQVVRTRWHQWISPSLTSSIAPSGAYRNKCPQSLKRKKTKRHTLKCSCQWVCRHGPRDFIILLRENYLPRLCLQSWEFSLLECALKDRASCHKPAIPNKTLLCPSSARLGL